MEFNDAAQAMQALSEAVDSALALEVEQLRESLRSLSLGPYPTTTRLLSFDDFTHPCIHPSRVGDPPAQGCEAAPNRKPKPWESVRWQPRTKR